MSLISLLSPLAVALPDHPGFLQNIGFQATGLLVVFTVLGAIWLIMEIMGAIFRRVAAVVPGAPAAAAPTASADDAVAPEVMAVIAAAVHEAVQEGGRIVSITPVGQSDAGQSLAWSGEGRRSHFASHKVR